MIKLIKQVMSFILISGVGFIIDFTVYYLLTSFCEIDVGYANMISAIPAVTYVFFISTRRTFESGKSKLSLSYKYLIYFIYQIFIVSGVSIFAQVLYINLYKISTEWLLISSNLNLIIKCMITPITMICNFFVIKFLCEKI